MLEYQQRIYLMNVLLEHSVQSVIHMFMKCARRCILQFAMHISSEQLKSRDELLYLVPFSTQ